MKNTIKKLNRKIGEYCVCARTKLSDCSGDSNIIAVILITVVVIGLAVVFRKQMNEIVSKLFSSVNSSIDSF